MRLFIAIELPEGIKAELAQVQQRLKDAGVDASWTRPEGMHVTLKFLGEIPEAKVPALREGIRSVAQGTGSFALGVEGAGAFPEPKNARVVWIGLSGDVERLRGLQEAIEDAMTRCGLKREARAFTPHLTLGRIKDIRSRDRWLTAFAGIRDSKLSGFTVTAVSLMQSELRQNGAVYTEVGSVELK